MKNHVLAVDIGNTNTHVGVIDLQTLTCVKSRSISSQADVADITAAITDIHTDYNSTNQAQLKICSVVSSLEKDLAKHFSSLPIFSPVHTFRYHKNLPITLQYKNPDTLGTDRIANCLYCAKKYPGKNCIIIDAGTTVTIDLFSSAGCFEGGFILPGLTVQLNSLNTDTSELPLVTDNKICGPFPPDSTQTAITGGVFYGLSGAITFIREKILQTFPQYTTTLSCGGAWESIAPYIDFENVCAPDMTLIGVGLYGE